MTSFEELAKRWARWTSNNADGGNTRVDFHREDDEIKKRVESVRSLEYEMIDVKYGPLENAKTCRNVVKSFINEDNEEMTIKEEIKTGEGYQTQSTVTSGFKVEVNIGFSFKVLNISGAVEFSCTKSETTQKSMERTETTTREFKIPRISKKVNYVTETKQKLEWTGKLVVRGQIGVYFDKKVCNAYGDGTTDHHYKWFPTAEHIIKWGISQGHEGWKVDQDKAYFEFKGKTDVTGFEFIFGAAEPL